MAKRSARRRPRSKTSGRSFWVTDQFQNEIVSSGATAKVLLNEFDWAVSGSANQLMRIDRIHMMLAFASTGLVASTSVPGTVVYALYSEDADVAGAKDPLVAAFYEEEDIIHVGTHTQRGKDVAGGDTFVYQVEWDIKAKRKLSRGKDILLAINNIKSDAASPTMGTLVSAITRFRITVL